MKQKKQVFLIVLFKFLVLQCRYFLLCVESMFFFTWTPCSTNICSWYRSIDLALKQLTFCAFQKHDSNEDLAYWLSNSSTLLIMLQKSLKAAGTTGSTPLKRPQTQSSFLGRMVCFNGYSWSGVTHLSQQDSAL